MEFPVKLKDVAKFEKLNNMSVHVCMLRTYSAKYKVSCCNIPSNKKEKHVNLLIIQNLYIDEHKENNHNDGDEILPKYHYVWIKSISRLLNSQPFKTHQKSHHCERCLQIFYSEERLKIHEIDCKNFNKCRINVPDIKNNIVLVIYADFECLLKPTENKNAFQLYEAQRLC